MKWFYSDLKEFKETIRNYLRIVKGIVPDNDALKVVKDWREAGGEDHNKEVARNAPFLWRAFFLYL